MPLFAVAASAFPSVGLPARRHFGFTDVFGKVKVVNLIIS